MNQPKKLTEHQIVKPIKKRILSVDVLRGFDMFWIIGGEYFFSALFVLLGGPFEEYLDPQMHHTKWEGFTFYDFIFPLFVFIVGMSVVFSLKKFVDKGDIEAAYKRIFKRFVILFLLGIIYNGGLSQGLENMRTFGVLQRLAITYLFAGIFYLHFNLKTLVGIVITILVGYWALLTFVPSPITGTTTLEYGKNLINWFDQNYVPFRMYKPLSEPEGILSTIPAIASSLLGVFTSLLLLNKKIEPKKKAYYFLAGGLVLVLLGYLWGLQFPIIKKLWTSSYVFVTGGYSIMLFGFFYLILDVYKVQKWSLPFVWIGMNPITIYMFVNLVDVRGIARRFIGNVDSTFLSNNIYDLVLMAMVIAINLILLRYLFNKKIFIRI
jgi:predicted acyltransferase